MELFIDNFVILCKGLSVTVLQQGPVEGSNDPAEGAAKTVTPRHRVR